MTDETIGKMLASLEHNTKITEKMADKVDSIGNDVSKIKGDIEGHAKYLKNLDDRIVNQRQSHEQLHERVTIIETKHASTSGILKWVVGIVGSIAASIVTYFATKP